MNKIERKAINLVKNYPFSLIALMGISVATLITTDTPALLSEFDKITHFTMYALMCSIFWYEYHRNNREIPSNKKLSIVLALPIIFGGILEILQGVLTSNRKCDVFDFIFNALGVLFALFLFLILKNAGINRASICKDIV